MKIVLGIFCAMLTTLQVAGQDAHFYFLFLHTNPDREALSRPEVDSIQSLHLENIGNLAREGKLLVAGPFEGGGGIFILNTKDYEEAEEWVLSDPAVRARRFRLELLPWKDVQGEPCLASQDASMVKYSYVRYVPHLTKFNIQQSPVLFKQHDDHMVKVRAAHEVITYGLFVPNDGGVLIVQGEPDRELIMADPAVRDGMLYPEFKEIWLAEGSFCDE